MGAVGIEHAHTVSQYRSLLRSGSGAQNQPSARPRIQYLVEIPPNSNCSTGLG